MLVAISFVLLIFSGGALSNRYRRSCEPENSCGPNSHAVECASSCPVTCANPQPVPCISSCNQNPCVCDDGYIFAQKDGPCINKTECPSKNETSCGPNSHAVECASSCPLTCANPEPVPCISSCNQNPCVCDDGYIFAQKDGPCINKTECPSTPPKCTDDTPKCGVNQSYINCKIDCPTQDCPVDDRRVFVLCTIPSPCPGGCACDRGYLYLSSENKACVKSSDCPPVECTRPNEVYDPQPTKCYSESCQERNVPCDFPDSTPRCVCKEGYYRNSEEICIPECECQTSCGPNSHAVECATSCPLTCAEPEPVPCIESCNQNPCVCDDGYILSAKDGVCINKTECPKTSCGPNSHAVECATSCPVTCANPETVPCISSCNQNPCVCDDGYILSAKDGVCINKTECPKTSCGPNSHAVECATSCPLTCANPEPVPCIDSCNQNPCVCDDGYILSAKDGVCINKAECPSKPPKCTDDTPKCGANQSYVDCKIDCPTQDCPVDDRRIFVLCIIPSPCPGGCACDPSYLYLNSEDKTCIKSSDCPPVECTRPNEVYDPQPTKCYSESCQERNVPCDFPDSTPRCVCKEGYYRNSEDICIPECECPPVCSVPDECKRTCANPNPPGCPYSPPSSNIDGCDCQEGFILSDYGGECIRVQDCPSGCNGDAHATARICPPPCPSTCSSPKQTPCKKMCETIGCACDPGYIYDDSCGMCVMPDDCPGGNPCGPNGTFVACSINCPRDFCPVDDNRGVAICDPPRDCPSGCACRFNHKRKSNEDPTCILATDCPPINCTRPNEEYCSCPSACLAERCEDRNNPPVDCNALLLDCQPACICKQGTYRNANDICVEPCQCE